MVIDELKDKHKWGQWETIKDEPILSEEGKTIGCVIEQKRICGKTKEVELKTISTEVESIYDWSKWTLASQSEITNGEDNKRTIGSLKVYERTCKRTGKVEVDKQEWRLGVKS